MTHQTRRETHLLPIQTREAPVVSVDAEARTVELVWTTGAGVQRYDYRLGRAFIEELSLDPKHIRMGRLESGKAPLLNTHSRWSLDDVLGVVQSATLSKTEGRATAKFSARDDVAPVFRDVQDGIIGNVSVGYNVHRFEMIPPKKDGELWRYVATDWEPTEISLVPIGADAGAGIRSDERAGDSAPEARSCACEFIAPEPQQRTVSPLPAAAGQHHEVRKMNEEERAAAEAERQATENEARIRKEAVAAERKRVDGIREAVRMAGLDTEYADELCRNDAMTVEAASLAVLRKLAERSEQNTTRSAANVQLVRDGGQTRRDAMVDSIVLRLDPRAKLKPEAIEAAREYRHMSLLRMAEDGLSAAGVSVRGLSGIEIAERALHSTSDFPAVLAAVLNKRLRMSYEESVKTYSLWARRAPNAPDFKNIQVTQLGATPDLLEVKEGGEFKYGTIAEGRETYKVVTYGRVVGITRQVIVNDDLRAFDRLVTAFAGSAARLENRLVYSQLTANANMGDGNALFSSAHGNLAASGAAISVATLSAGRSAMRLQKGLASEELNITPRYLIVPTALEQVAYQFTSSQYVPATAATINEFRAGGRTSLEPIVEPVLDANSASRWYLAADSNAIDTIEYCYLDGSEGVYLENQVGFDIDGMKMKARLDFATKAIDWRGLYANPGA